MIACSTNKRAGASSEKVYTKDSLLAAIERGACFGRCPEYKATIYKSGYAEYTGRRNVEKIGSYFGRLSNEELLTLKTLMRSNKMEEKDTAYINKYLADFPGWALWVSDLKPTKTIVISHEAPPAEITDFGKGLDQALNSIKWVKKATIKDE